MTKDYKLEKSNKVSTRRLANNVLNSSIIALLNVPGLGGLGMVGGAGRCGGGGGGGGGDRRGVFNRLPVFLLRNTSLNSAMTRCLGV